MKICSICNKKRRSDKFRKWSRITIEEYNILLKKQKGKCAICKIDKDPIGRKFAVDHQHKSGKIRGLLCGNCNRGIGLLQDDPKIILQAFKYVEKNYGKF